MTYLKECDPVAGCGKTFPGDLNNCPSCGNIEWACNDASHLIDPMHYTYDIETYPNAFTCVTTHVASGTQWVHEISERHDDRQSFIEFMYQLSNIGVSLIGYNNNGFDYPVIHFILTRPNCTVGDIYSKAMSIIKSNDRFGNTVWESDHIVKQIDLFKMHHFDNQAKSTSLKQLEFVMRMRNIEDLPFDVGIKLNTNQIDSLIYYNRHDVKATTLFYVRSLSEMKLRQSLSVKYNVNMINYSDSKIGSTILINELEKVGIQCFDHSSGRKRPLQTMRPEIKLSDAIFNYVKFEHPEFKRVKNYLASLVINETKGVFKELHATVQGNEYHFGTGGLHMSVPSQIVESSDTHQLIDVDVASYYPNLAIMNKMYPAHLGVEFCDIYESIYQQRKSFAKGTAENAALKIALNASFGNSNNKYSPLYDPFYTMQTTINGQLLLCMLVEQLIKIPGLSMVQCNTDGVTYLCPKPYIEHTRNLCKWWEQLTCLELEEVFYKRMLIRDVNNYIAEYEDGKVKRKGAYEYDRGWHQNHSELIVPKAVFEHLVNGKDLETFIREHKDPFDFCSVAKIPRSNNLIMRYTELDLDLPLANIVRYYVSNDGGSLVKIAPPTGKHGTWKRKNGITDQYYERITEDLRSNMGQLDALGGIPSQNGMTYEGTFFEWDADSIPHDERIHTKNKSKYETREMSIAAGWKVTDCSNMDNFDWSILNYDYYINEAKKLIEPLLTTS